MRQIVQALQLNPVPGTKVAHAPWPAQQSPIAPAVKLRQVSSLATHGTANKEYYHI